MNADPVDPELKTVLNKAARVLNDLFLGRYFVLLTFDKMRNPKTGEKRVNYIGNNSRDHMAAALHEFLGKLRGMNDGQIVQDVLPSIIPEGTPVGTKLAVVFTTTEDGITRPELMEWCEDGTTMKGTADDAHGDRPKSS